MSGNGKGEESERKLMCPFLGEYCIEGRCAVYDALVREVGGMRQELGICGLKAGNAILSEINRVLHQQQGGRAVPKIVLPRG